MQGDYSLAALPVKYILQRVGQKKGEERGHEGTEFTSCLWRTASLGVGHTSTSRSRSVTASLTRLRPTSLPPSRCTHSRQSPAANRAPAGRSLPESGRAAHCNAFAVDDGGTTTPPSRPGASVTAKNVFCLAEQVNIYFISSAGFTARD